MKLTNITVGIGVLALGAACGEELPGAKSGLFDTTGSALITEADAEDLAVRLLGGRVLETERGTEDGMEVYEIDVERASGAVVEIEIEIESGLVVEVESDDYVEGDDLDVGGGLVTLAEAVATATTAAPGTVESWEIDRDGDDERWEWEIEIRTLSGDDVEVEIDAETGAIRDDDDGDDDSDGDDDGSDDDCDDDSDGDDDHDDSDDDAEDDDGSDDDDDDDD